ENAIARPDICHMRAAVARELVKSYSCQLRRNVRAESYSQFSRPILPGIGHGVTSRTPEAYEVCCGGFRVQPIFIARRNPVRALTINDAQAHGQEQRWNHFSPVHSEIIIRLFPLPAV